MSPLPALASGTDTALTASTLQFGGNSGILTRSRLFRWETLGQVQIAAGKAARAPDQACCRRAFRRNGAGRLHESARNIWVRVAGRPRRESPGLVHANSHVADESRGDWNAFLSAGDLWRATSTLQLIYIRLRADANHFTKTPAFNQAVLSRFGLRTDDAPNSIDLSPRLGFTWQASPRTTIRGGTGQFRNLVDASLLAVPWVSTGLAGSTTRLSCVGSAVPTPDWRGYAGDPASIPTTCAGGTSPLVDAAPSVQLVDPHYRPARSWRSNLGFASTIARNVVSRWTAAVTQRESGGHDRRQPSWAIALHVGRRGARRLRSAIEHRRRDRCALADRGARRQRLRAGGACGIGPSQRHRQAIVTWRPFIPDNARRFFGDVVASYTLTAFARANAATTARRSVIRPRKSGHAAISTHATCSSSRRFSGPSAISERCSFFSGRAHSDSRSRRGLRDVNGDGLANDRAFIADSPALRSLIASSLVEVAQCLTSQIGRAAGRTAATGRGRRR